MNPISKTYKVGDKFVKAYDCFYLQLFPYYAEFELDSEEACIAFDPFAELDFNLIEMSEDEKRAMEHYQDAIYDAIGDKPVLTCDASDSLMAQFGNNPLYELSVDIFAANKSNRLENSLLSREKLNV